MKKRKNKKGKKIKLEIYKCKISNRSNNEKNISPKGVRNEGRY